ncbi:hypothetical protein P7C70_g2754, partial [Phenoliferia sp. Uapishka_3]
MSTPTPTLPEGAVWVDQGPLSLVETPVNLTGKTDMFTMGASHMALLHNVILRGFNSIYLQAPAIKESDVPDFVGYALAWCRFTKASRLSGRGAHHDDEEESLFPKLEEVVGVEGLMRDSLVEHHLFEEGLLAMMTYLSSIPTTLPASLIAASFSATRLIELMDAFKEPFGKHFGQEGEIAHIASFIEKYPDQPALRPVFATWGKQSLMKTGVLDGIPFMFCNLDRTVEGGRWTDWPRIPGPVKWGMINIGGAWNARLWRFGSCSKDGQKRVLEAFK